jgi:hypothetical protein
MRRFFLAASSLIVLCTIATPSFAWNTIAQVVITDRRATSVTTASSSKFEIQVHTLKTTAEIFEEGMRRDTHDVTCNKTADADGLPMNLSCTSRAHDSSPVVLCEYCAEGYSEGFTFVFFSLGIKNAVPDCRRYVP